MNTLKRIGIGILIALGLTIIGIAGVIVLDPVFGGSSPTELANTSYIDADEHAQAAYIAIPSGGSGSAAPAVLMFHEWWGLNAEIVEMADLLAEEGYVVFVPDLFRGQSASTVPRALYMRVMVPEEQIDADADAAFAHFSGMDSVDRTRDATIGFCFGGGVSLRLATRHADDLTATVTLYGDTPSDPAALGKLKNNGPLFGIYGREDALVPVEDVNRFEEALQAAGVDYQIQVYPGVGHAFIQPDVIAESGSPKDAWMDILVFLDDTLMP